MKPFLIIVKRSNSSASKTWLPKTIESLITGFGGTPTTKPITQKPIDPVYLGVSPLYEDVKDPAYELGNLYGLTGMTETFRVGLNALLGILK